MSNKNLSLLAEYFCIYIINIFEISLQWSLWWITFGRSQKTTESDSSHQISKAILRHAYFISSSVKSVSLDVILS